VKHLKRILYTFGDYFIFALVSLVLLTSIFSFALKGGVLKIICTALTAFMSWSSLYGYYWNNSRKDWRYIKSETKRNPEFTDEFKPYLGFLHSLPFVLVNAVLAFLALTKEGIYAIVFRILNICCMGFIMNDKGVLNVIGVSVAVLVPLIVCTVGYIVGRTGFSITDRYLPWLVYKKPKNKDNKNNGKLKK